MKTLDLLCSPIFYLFSVMNYKKYRAVGFNHRSHWIMLTGAGLSQRVILRSFIGTPYAPSRNIKFSPRKDEFSGKRQFGGVANNSGNVQLFGHDSNLKGNSQIYMRDNVVATDSLETHPSLGVVVNRVGWGKVGHMG